MTLIVSILILAYLIARLRPGAHPMAANAGKNRKASQDVPRRDRHRCPVGSGTPELVDLHQTDVP